ncbi:MAG: type I restriction enzyme HsdR N-terminal domain-containing protein [Bacteroidales bacterium]|nr:type I restriction enzyme HsdR N-terminal domain-containing protein [Bacteroidales bacterium]
MRHQTIYDPLRRRDVALTPEEQVRQWFIGVLSEEFKIPRHMMMSEVPMQFGDARKQYRADIVVYDRAASPLMIVECKRPDVAISQDVIDQALRYHSVMDVAYIVLTNGHSTYMFGRSGSGFIPLSSIPSWDTMLQTK